ncbi:MAG: DUF4381 domain-containing protein [Alphaproteobacteria bacterium]|nr:DUF4381 domain-containing protein [Alphaproteobacteria bacterium]
MNDALKQLYDIEGLDPISWWPLGQGWWLLIILIVMFVIGLSILYFKRQALKRSWQHVILNQLSDFEKNLCEENAQATVAQLSELLRRIAMHQYSRVECAGLEGKVWLSWLKRHDPQQFDWETKGKILVEAPYSPSPIAVSLEEVLDFIKAIRRWVK